MKCAISLVALGLAATAQAAYYEYTTVTGYFLQDEASTDPSTFDYTANNFGLINRTYDTDANNENSKLTQWQRFYNHVHELNKHAPHKTEYKVFFFGRHGEGWHNAAESLYGTPAWNCYWSLLDGNGTVTWSDADLTPSGIAQAQTAHDFWASLIARDGMHTPDAYFVSPLTRALRTANITFSDLNLPKKAAAFRPLVMEGLREGISLHTCDHRRSRSYIKGLFPGWEIEEGFSEEDKLWNGVTGETSAAQDVRSKDALDEMFERTDTKDLFVSVTAHSGEIASLLRVLGHRAFSLKTGAVIPVLVKAKKSSNKYAPEPTTVSWTTSAHCTAPPVTSVTACVCASSAAPVTTPLATGF
ncbi:phosphomutase-like protein 3 [Aspergillus lentulus]|uniref:Phosphomutase-like protein 3 n=2 Tax=Aspergillus lentulus TaxID=293939 RepID=A0AAN4PQ31_ASPLE|nr:phosphomutase-like protein 3 [Aspergillus lentulus]GFF52918.1 phosphomutase-like protein 3 [Aspergillus lentulus]GFF72397.1 phosphomutase-like protein 3 [Aspergillus lentulus]